MLLHLLLSTLLAPTCPTAAGPALQDPASRSHAEVTFDARLERLVERLEEARESMHVPGMSLVVVRDDAVLLTHGFGVADLDSRRPVTSETIFGIGSTTKAFTATLLGMLADDDLLDWDDPVVKHLPYFELDTGDGRAEVTLRDLLSHRSGFTRMTMLSLNPAVSRELILRTAAQAEPWAPFRKEFHYNNVMFLASGMVAGAVTHSSWDDLIAKRIFEPLGMHSSGTTFAAAGKSEALAKGYLWNEDTGEYDVKPMVNIDSIGPAGSINSNVIDMAQWLRLQLGRGEIDGKRLISEERLEATWSAQTPVADGVSYGLGWFVRDWNGQPLLEHGGNIEGFAAQVAFVPDARVGYALLTNVSVTPLQSASLEIVFETLLGEWKEPSEEGVAQPANFDDYVGKYVANFATFKDTLFTVQVQDGKLAVDVPGQMVYALKPPGDDGKWSFELTDQIAVSFERDDDGQVVEMKMYQAGYSFELPREGIELAPEIPLEKLQRYLGTFARSDGKGQGRILIQNNRLALDVPDEMVFELRPPDENELWAFRIRGELAVSFQESEEGRIDAITLHRPDSETTFSRVADPSQEAPPTVAELMALRRPEQRLAMLDAQAARRVTGTARFVNAGLEGSYTVWVDGRERYSEELDFGPFGITRSTIDGQRGWSDDPLRGVTPLSGDELELAILGHPSNDDDDWRAVYDSVIVLGVDELEGRRVARVRLEKGELPARTVLVDTETGDILRSEATMVSSMVSIPITTRYEDFQEVEGVRVPRRFVVENNWSGRLIIEVHDVEHDVAIDPERFEMGAVGKR